jgi:hypothetical protein
MFIQIARPMLAPGVRLLGLQMNTSLAQLACFLLVGGWPGFLPLQIQPLFARLSYQNLTDSFKGGSSLNAELVLNCSTAFEFMKAKRALSFLLFQCNIFAMGDGSGAVVRKLTAICDQET